MTWQKEGWPGLAADLESAGHGNHDVKGTNFPRKPFGRDCLFNLWSTYRLG
jgi:hypothetical protein